MNWRAEDWECPELDDDEECYMVTVEHVLNLAIYYTAVAMNQAIDSYDGCECKMNERGEDGNPAIRDYSIYNFLFILMTTTSLLASIFALGSFGLSNKIKS